MLVFFLSWDLLFFKLHYHTVEGLVFVLLYTFFLLKRMYTSIMHVRERRRMDQFATASVLWSKIRQEKAQEPTTDER